MLGTKLLLKTTSAALLIATISCSLPQHNNDCSRFEAGKFSFHGENSSHDFSIERNDSVQTETDLTTGSITRLKIKWVGPCEYELRFLSKQGIPTDSLPFIAKATVLKTKIVEVKDTYYVFSSYVNGMEDQSNDTMYIAKPELL